MPSADPGATPPTRSPRFTCPFCASSDVVRLFLASLHLDTCECRTCAARWDEDADSGEFRGRAASTLLTAGPERRRSTPTS